MAEEVAAEESRRQGNKLFVLKFVSYLLHLGYALFDSCFYLLKLCLSNFMVISDGILVTDMVWFFVRYGKHVFVDMVYVFWL